jgi:hypothetical protein
LFYDWQKLMLMNIRPTALSTIFEAKPEFELGQYKAGLYPSPEQVSCAMAGTMID